MQVRVRCSNRTDKLDGYVVVDGPGDRCVHYTVRYGL
jgi:hypothetical protein